jgi:hypothetical protein
LPGSFIFFGSFYLFVFAAAASAVPFRVAVSRLGHYPKRELATPPEESAGSPFVRCQPIPREPVLPVDVIG